MQMKWNAEHTKQNTQLTDGCSPESERAGERESSSASAEFERVWGRATARARARYTKEFGYCWRTKLSCSVLFSARVRSAALSEHLWQLWLACWDEKLASRSAESKQNKENKKIGGKQMLLDNNGHGTAATAANKHQLWQRQVPESEEIRDRRSTDHHWHFELAFLRCVQVTVLSPLTLC